MDAIQFDAWTRRRFGLAFGGRSAVLLGLAATDNVGAKKHRHKRKKKCRKTLQSCGGKKKCCKSLTCGETLVFGPNHCCKPIRGTCTDANDCCGDLVCTVIFGLSGVRCCSFSGACTEDLDCCVGLSCFNGDCL